MNRKELGSSRRLYTISIIRLLSLWCAVVRYRCKVLLNWIHFEALIEIGLVLIGDKVLVI